jgi:ABC-2 type transport system ATP-binding protein
LSNLILKADSLYKSYTSHQAVIDFSLEVSKGEICSLIGQNGAGKSSILRMLAGVFLPDKGVLSLFTEKKIGYLPEERGLYQEMQVLEQLEFLAKLKGLSDQEAKTKSELALDKYGLGDWKKKKIKQLSKGMQQKVQILSTVLHEPELLILDEPTNGLDPNGIIEMRNLLKKLNEENGTTILISSHLLPEIEKIASHVGIIHHGKMLFEGTMNDLQEMKNVPVGITFHVSDLEKTKSLFAQNSWSFEQEKEFFATAFESNELVAKQVKTLVENGISVYSCVPKINDLEQIFLDITQN